MAMAGFSGMSPDDVAYRRKLAAAMAGEATSAAPVGHWTQALARALQGGMSGLNADAAREGERTGRESTRAALSSIASGNPDVGAMTANPWTAHLGEQVAMGQYKEHTPTALLDRRLRTEAGARAEAMHPLEMAARRASTDASAASAAATRGGEARAAGLHPYAVARAADATSEGRAALFDRHFPPAADDDPTRAERRARFIATGALPDKPESVKFTALPPGGELVAHDTRTGRVLERYAGPEKPPDSTARRATYDAVDALPALRGTIETLREARELVPRAYHGYLSGMRAAVNLGTPDFAGSSIISDRAAAEATRRLNDILSSGALSSMSATLKGATTNFELQKFERIMADPNVSPAIKLATIDTMLRLAEREVRVKVDRVRELGGTIPPELMGDVAGPPARPGATFSPPGGRPGAPPPATGAPSGAPASDLRRALEAATPGTTYKFPNGETRVKGPDGNWYLPNEVPR